MYPTLCELAGLEQPKHLEGTCFAPVLADPDREWETAAFSQFPNPALREWAANPLQASMRETFFGPLIKEVEERIIAQQGERWDRDLYENKLMGYTKPRVVIDSWFGKISASRTRSRWMWSFTTTRSIRGKGSTCPKRNPRKLRSCCHISTRAGRGICLRVFPLSNQGLVSGYSVTVGSDACPMK